MKTSVEVADDLEQLLKTMERRKVVLDRHDALAELGYLPPDRILTREDVLEAATMLDRPPYVGNMMDVTDKVSPRYRTWGFRILVAVKGDGATVFHFGNPIMQVNSDYWVWLEYSAEEDVNREFVERAQDFLENWGVESTAEKRAAYTWNGVRDLVDEIQGRFL